MACARVQCSLKQQFKTETDHIGCVGNNSLVRPRLYTPDQGLKQYEIKLVSCCLRPGSNYRLQIESLTCQTQDPTKVFENFRTAISFVFHCNVLSFLAALSLQLALVVICHAIRTAYGICNIRAILCAWTLAGRRTVRFFYAP